MFDLHIHSFYSNDGEFSPAVLADKCVQSKIQVMAVTDHNTVAATKEAKSAAKLHKIKYIPGIEIDCTFKNTNFHVLGLGIDYSDTVFQEIEDNIRAQGKTISHMRLEKIQELGFAINESDLNALAQDSYWPETWTGEMFAEVILSHPQYQNDTRLDTYRPGGGRSDNPLANFYWDFFAQGKPCFAKATFPDMQKIIDIIHQTHGLAILAHPCVNLKEKLYLLDGIVKIGIDGIEAFSSYHSKEQAAFMYKFAKEHGLITTCGSDFHGKIKPAINLGQHHCTLSNDEINALLTKLL